MTQTVKSEFEAQLLAFLIAFYFLSYCQSLTWATLSSAAVAQICCPVARSIVGEVFLLQIFSFPTIHGCVLLSTVVEEVLCLDDNEGKLVTSQISGGGGAVDTTHTFGVGYLG